MYNTHFFFPNRLRARLSFFSSTALAVPLFLPSLGPRRLNSFFFSPLRSPFIISYSVVSGYQCSSFSFSFSFSFSSARCPHRAPGLNSNTFLSYTFLTICFAPLWGPSTPNATAPTT